MIKLFKVKERQRELAENANGKYRLNRTRIKLAHSAFPNSKDDLMNFEVTIRPDEGYYLGGTFVFSFQISSIYPHEAPKIALSAKEIDVAEWKGDILAVGVTEKDMTKDDSKSQWFLEFQVMVPKESASLALGSLLQTHTLFAILARRLQLLQRMLKLVMLA
ncbi:hypothetical protein OIU79_026624 [Salix purpurea]|uniref:UBC core domain-containing protein n=1 Tax=Salix purpurea TaxID=77065 RepID=A0A9Q0VRX7_SALPP|nr:hypothetical protein OIU79_026624 [Salix purpurea]